MRRILIDAEVMRVAERYADVLSADKIVGWRERPIDRLRQIRDDLIEDCNYKLAIYTGCIINNYRDILLFPSFAVVCTINSIKVVKYQQINAK